MTQRRLSAMVRSLLLAFTLCLPATAAAGPIGFAGPMSWTGTGYGASVLATLTLTSGEGISARWAGELSWLWGTDGSAATIAAAPAGFAQAFYSYCVDISQFLDNPQQTVVVSSLGFYQSSNVAQGGSKAAWLFNQYAAAIRNNLVTDVNNRAAALQIAIWEALYDNSVNLAGGAFKLATSGPIATYATNYLNALYSNQAAWSSSSALILLTSSGQDQITNIAVAVPEVSTAAMLGIALFFVATWPRRLPVTRYSLTAVLFGLAIALPAICSAAVPTVQVPEPSTAILLLAAGGIGVVVRGVRRIF